MGTNNLTSRTDGETIPANDHNELVNALLEDLVPRNLSRVATNDAGQLGTSALRWLRSYIGEMFIGTAANNLKIYEPTSGVIRIEDGDTNRYIQISSTEIKLQLSTTAYFSLTSNEAKLQLSTTAYFSLTSNEAKLQINANDYITLDGDSLDVYIDGVNEFNINSSGIDWTVQSSASIPREKVDGYIFSSQEIIDLDDVAEADELVKSSLPNDAMVICQFYGDGDGSRAYLYSNTNFTTDDAAIIHAVWGYDATLWPYFVNCNFAKSGSNLRMNSTDWTSGRLKAKIFINYMA